MDTHNKVRSVNDALEFERNRSKTKRIRRGFERQEYKVYVSINGKLTAIRAF